MKRQLAVFMFASCVLAYAQNVPSYVQGTYSNTEWGVGGPYSTITDTFTSNTTVGDTIIAVVQNDDHATVTGCTDNVNSKAYIEGAVVNDTGATQAMSLWYFPNTSAGMATVTCTFSSPTGINNIALLEYKGLGSLDAQTLGYSGSATSALSLGPISTTAAGDLVIGAFADTNTGHWSFSQGSGYTTRVENGSVGGTDVEDMTQAAPGSVVATGSISPADTWMGVMVAFKPATSFVQGTYSNTEWGVGGPYSTITDTFTSNTTVGDTIIAVVQNDDHATVTGCTDNVNSKAYIEGAVVNDTGATQAMSLWYFPNTSAGMATVTCTFSSPTGINNIALLEYKGLGSLDAQTSGYSGSATSALSLGPISTTAAGDLVIGAFADTNTGHWSFSQGSGYTTRVENGSVGGTDVEDMTQAAPGSVVATGSISPADTWMGVMVAFKPATSLPTPTLSVSGLPNPSTFGQAVTLTATISSGPTGTITFYDGGGSIGTGTISGTNATMTTTSLAAGSHTITASWPGNSSYNSVTSGPYMQTVTSTTPTLIVSGSPNPSQIGSGVTLTATISNGLTGTITFYDGGSSLGTGTLNSGAATLTTSSLSAGSHTITASWPGNGSYGPVTSIPFTETVNLPTPTLTLSSSLDPSPLSAGVTFTATISNGLTGTITFYNGGTSIGTGSISGMTATFTTSSLPAGNDAIAASWPGNGTFGPVTSSPLTQTVHQPVSGQSIYSYAAGYDGVGNITSYTDSVMGTINFTYDTLNRLATANGNEPGNPYPNNCWNYDSFGNRTMQMSASVAFPNTMGGPTACQTTGSLGPVTQAQFNGTVNGVNNNQISWTSTNSNQSQGYDQAGNIKNDGAHQFLYDAEGRICEELTTMVGVTTAYIYDANGNRVAKGSANWGSCDPSANGFQASTDYVLSPGGEQLTEVMVSNGSPTGVAHTNVWAAGMVLATYDVDGLHFYLDDPLGTRRVQTDYAGVVEQTCQSLPFGDGETCFPSPTEHLFTGKERDTESGNDYFGARYYSSAMGRFMSPDWSDDPKPVPYADFENPQSLNLYSYAGNNPLTRTDPNGHCDVDGEHHGGVWCFFHTLGFVETQHEQAEFARQFFANSGLVILRNGHPVDPSQESDKSLIGMLNALRTQAAADCYNIGKCGGVPVPDSGNLLAALAPNIVNTLNSIDATGKNLPNQAGGQTFQNRDGKLPSTDANGNPISYKEWDTEASKQLGKARSGERLVTGSDGSAYLTTDHYQSFTQIR